MENNCAAWRERLAGDPRLASDDFERHAQACGACAAWRDRLLHAEDLIANALRFNIGAMSDRAAAVRAAVGRGSPARPPRPPARSARRFMLTGGIAACLLAALTIWALLGSGMALTDDELAQAVVDHWYHEPDSVAPSATTVADARLAAVLGDAVAIDRTRLQRLTFARNCRVGGMRIPHLVVQGEQGPYMVLLFPGLTLERELPLALPAEALAGRLVRANGGSIAVLGTESDELARVEAAVVAAVSWEI